VKPLVVVLALVVFIVVGASVLLDAGCGNDVLAEHASPDGRWKAVVFQRDCGATTDFSTQVSVIRASRGIRNSPGNVFVTDTDHGIAPSGPGGGPEVRVRWESPDLLVIAHHEAARVFRSEEAVGSIRVEYERFDR